VSASDVNVFKTEGKSLINTNTCPMLMMIVRLIKKHLDGRTYQRGLKMKCH